MTISLTPIISCRHNRSYIFAEYLEPELESISREVIAALLRSVWPLGGLSIGSSGLHVLAYPGEEVNIRNLRHITSDLGFRFARSVPQTLGGSQVLFMEVISSSGPISLPDEMCILPPVIRKPLSELHAPRSRSDSIDEIMGRVTSVRDDMPFTIQTSPSHYVVICPRCKDICSVNDQRRIGQSEDRFLSQKQSSIEPPPPAYKSHLRSSVQSLLEDNRESTKSESIQSFTSSVSSRSEISHNVRQSMHITSLPMTPVRRSSCPDVVSIQRSSISSFDNFREPITTSHKPALSVLRTSHVFSQPVVPNNSIASVSSTHSIESEKMKRRIKQSLSRISESAISRKSSSRHSRRRDSGATVNFDQSDPVSECSEDIQEILSPISKRSENDQENLGTLRISGAGGKGLRQPPTSSPFVPSERGRELMAVFNHSVNPHDQQAQNKMWDSFIRCARNPIEYADVCDKMPTLVYCLRGLIRFADPEFASRHRPDVLPYLFMLILGRHCIAEEKSFIEAVECCCGILGSLAVDPLSRTSQNNIRPRQSFEKSLLSQNCGILQQLVGALAQQLPRWITTESLQDSKLPLITRALQSILDILFIYVYRLREHWFSAAPQQFKDLLPRLMASVADKFPCHTERIVSILDVILDHANPNNCKQVGHILKSAIQKSSPSDSLTGTLNRWSAVPPGPPTQTRALSNLFGLIRTKSLKPSYTAKTIVIQEIKTGATL